MKRIFLILSLLCLANSFLFAQEQFSNSRTFDLHIMPYTLLDYTPRLRIGAEYYSGGKFAYCLEAGYGSSTLNSGRLLGMIWGRDYSFYEVRPELKYYFFNRENYFTLYFSGELFALWMNDRLVNTDYIPKYSYTLVNYDEAEFYKQKYGFHIKVGMKLLALKTISLDFYGGIGAAYRAIDYRNLKSIRPSQDYLFEEWFPQTYKHEGKSVILHLTMGCKVGFNFVKRNTEL